MSAMNANRMLSITTTNQKKSTEKLSSGYRINRAGDDAAGLAISEKMRGQIKGLNKASSNAQDGISLIQTAEGALTETHSIIQRMRELAVQSATDTNTDDDRTQIQNEINQLTQEVDRIANTTEFNTKKLLNGDRKGAVSAKAGTGSVEGTFAAANVRTQSTGLQFSMCGVTDVIRIEFKTDMTTTTLSSLSDQVSITSIFGEHSHVAISNGKIEISQGAVFSTLDFAIAPGNAGTPIEASITGFDNIKAGDVITITLGKAVQTEAAATGKDALRLQVGANAGQEVALGINDMGTSALKISKGGSALNVSTQDNASKAINAYDMAIQKVSTERAKMGAMQNRLEHTIANLDSAAENTQNSESRIRDTDMASEMVEFSKNNILAQAGQSMLAQANQSNQGVLSLLG
jgi:flagellin